jgi:predicted ATPase
MLIVRDIFTARPGKATKLAKLFKKGFAAQPHTRIMTDLVSDYNTVVVEMPVADLSEFERLMQEYRTGKMNPPMDPKVAEEMSTYTELWLTGRREIFQIVE